MLKPIREATTPEALKALTVRFGGMKNLTVGEAHAISRTINDKAKELGVAQAFLFDWYNAGRKEVARA